MNKKISFPIAIMIIVVFAVVVGLIVWKYGFIPRIEFPIAFPLKTTECKTDSDCGGCGSGCVPFALSQTDPCHVGLELVECACINNKCVVKPRVNIITDKTEYEQGETISYTVKNVSDHPIWFPPYLIIEKKLDDEQVRGYSTFPCLGPGRVREAPQPIKIESGGEYNSSWNQIFCDSHVSKNVTASLGIYRMRFLYSDEWSIEYPKSAYSNEFKIK